MPGGGGTRLNTGHGYAVVLVVGCGGSRVPYDETKWFSAHTGKPHAGEEVTDGGNVGDRGVGSNPGGGGGFSLPKRDGPLPSSGAVGADDERNKWDVLEDAQEEA